MNMYVGDWWETNPEILNSLKGKKITRTNVRIDLPTYV